MAQDGRPDSPAVTPGSTPTIALFPATESTSGDINTDSKGGVVKRAMEKTASKLGRGKPGLSQSQPALPQPGHGRMFSLTRGKGKERQIEGDLPTSRSQQLSSPPSSPPLSPRKHPRTSGTGDDESPFITPGSPSMGPNRPENLIFRGFRSMHAGTQSFIQALQAVPWAEDQDNDDEYMNHDVTPAEAESDEDDRKVNRLTSSIHAIYRPLARFRRGEPSASSHRTAKSPDLPSVSDSEDTPRTDDSLPSDEDTEGDFDHPVGGVITDHSHAGRVSPETIPDLDGSVPDVSSMRDRTTSRAGSMVTVKPNRRAQLAGKLRDVFELEDIQEVVAEMPCWLLRSVLLQGYMYLTDAYICFFAHLPSREDQTLKSGSLLKKAQRTKRWIRHWFILKNDVLSWYQSSSDPYFPHGVVDLRYAISCEPVDQKDIRLRTHQKSIRLSADSVPSRDEWVKAIRKVMLKAQNMGDTIKIAIPYPTVVDVERSNAMDFSETIEIKVQDKSMDLALDSYFFAYFPDLPAALEQIRDAVRTYRTTSSSPHSPMVVDTTAGRSPTARAGDRAQTAPVVEQGTKPPSTFRLSSLLKPLQETLPIGRSFSAPSGNDTNNEEFTHIVKRTGSSFVPVTTQPGTTPPNEGEPSGRPDPLHSSASSLTAAPTPTPSDHTYPPSTFASSVDIRGSAAKDSASGTGWSVGIPSIPSWLRSPSRSLFGTPSTSVRPAIAHATTMLAQLPSVTEVVSTSGSSSRKPTNSTSTSSGDFGYFSMVETPETTAEAQTAIEKFRQAFALDDKESLLGIFPGYLFRMLPVYGRLYVSTNYFCFKSSGALNSRTRMILPLKDILATEKQKSYRFAHYGLVIIVKGHEELFFEFVDEERRDEFVAVIQRQLEEVRRRLNSGDARTSASPCHDALILEEFGSRHPLDLSESQTSLSESAPAYMFTSQSSTFLSFKPDKSLHFTFLTIGSRGDVQPYIALAKGLLADGHRVRIATHGEFREWVESHGIEFGYVGGDPAELMRICVENGTFTVAFLREGVQKFRGWIDDLLKTSWEACQGTDVLVESPSAMAGYHIAEALKIPYFRAFTMTWSRTRAYPHAFAVPENKMGGNYNYMTYVLFDQVFWRGTAGQINRWRRHTLGLPSTSLDKMEPHKIPFLYNFSPTVVPRPLDWPEWIRVTGYWFLDDADVSSKKWEPPQDLLDFMNLARKANKKVVYIGFGSIVVPDPKAMTRCVIEAIVQSGVHAILSKGWSDRLVKDAPAQTEPEEPLPKQIYPISSIPHDWLFKQIDAACHHGGAGTTGASLRAGIPTIIKPFFGDQFFWADRVEALGIGAAVRKLTVDSLADALHEATTNQKLIERAKLVGEQIRAENGVATAIEAIYRDLEYARSLIKGAAQRDAQIEPEEYFDAEHATIRDYPASSTPPEHPSPSCSASGAVSDWSVISDSDEPEHESRSSP